ncbi:MAG: hypothetical protein JXA10_01080 [Anaerolineae bacterium]|nr:hypothetical protein [Anaerolineae bacterium]
MMTETPYKDFDSLFGQIIALYTEGNYAQAVNLATAGIAQLPQNARFLRLVRSMIQVRSGKHDAGLDELRDLIEGGYWLGDYFWRDSDYDAVRDLPEFKRLQQLSNERLDAAKGRTTPELVTFVPDDSADPKPMLFALHGNGSNVFWHQDHWQPATANGWIVAMPQSSQLAGMDSHDNFAYSWDDEDIVDQEIETHLAALTANYPIDPARVVVGGFSRGAETAIRLVLTGKVAAQGFIAVCPGGPYSREPELWQPVVEAAKEAKRDVRGYVIIGGQDQFEDETDQLIAMLHEAGIPCEREFHADMGHDYPADFKARVGELVKSVLGK